MRKKELKIVFTFASTALAMKMEKTMKEAGAPGRIIPVPKAITAGCGLSYVVSPEDKEQVLQIMSENQLEAEKIVELML